MASGPAKHAVRVVIISLLIDLLAFTLPLPLFPRIIEAYIADEARTLPHDSLLSRLLMLMGGARERLQRTAVQGLVAQGTQHKYDIVLLGGFLGSLFSVCQFLVSPVIGSMSDRFGRRKVLLFTMAGNIASALVWLFAKDFKWFVASRIIGGLSEGNTQLAIAIISDVTTPEERGRSLALVGMCFATAFSFGPPLGAYLAKNVTAWTTWRPVQAGLTEFSLPALVTVVLLSIETLYIYLALPETGGRSVPKETKKAATSKAKPIAARRAQLRKLELILFVFSFLFSGAEFTLTFLTFDLFSYTNAQNGKLLGIIGILSSLVQGGVVRRYAGENRLGAFAESGLTSFFLALNFLAWLPTSIKQGLSSLALWSAALAFAWSSATVVNSLNALASLECDDDDAGPLPKGKTLGRFRSAGQLGRAAGPLAVTSAYWAFGPTITYLMASVALMVGCIPGGGRSALRQSTFKVE